MQRQSVVMMSVLMMLFAATACAQSARPSHQLAEGHFSPAKFPLVAVYPRPDSETAAESYHRVAYPGMRWDCPVRAAFGAYPYHATILKAPEGMTIGSWLVEKPDGELVEDAAYCTLTWPEPVAGTYPIEVKITDQEGKAVTFAWTLVVDRTHHYFAGPAATGKGDGSSRADQAAFSDVYGPSDESPSPAKAKVVVLATGSYPLAKAIHLSAARGKPVSIMAYPGDTPEIVAEGKGTRIYHHSSDSMLTGLRMRGFRIGNAGCITTPDGADRLAVWRNSFIDCAGDPTVSNNESIWFCARTNQSVKRKYLLMAENTYEGVVDMAVFTFYAVGPLLSERDVFISHEASLHEPVWFPKAVCDYDLRRHRFDNPNTAAPISGVLDPHNNVQEGSASGEVRYNFVRSKGTGAAVFWNGAAVASARECYDYRNTYIGGAVVAKDWTKSNRVIFAANVIQNDAGGIHANSAGFTTQDTECHGKTDIVDQDGKLTGTLREAFLGRRGYHIFDGKR